MIEDTLVIMPAFNESAAIGRTLAELLPVAPHVLVVDDGSSDDTAARAAAAGARVLRLPTNLGYGGALQAGFRYALRRTAFPFLATFDADGQHDPSYLPALLEPVRDGRLDYVVGSRCLTGPRADLRARVNWVFAALASVSTGRRITDATSGMLALHREVASVFLLDLFPQDYPDADMIIMLSGMGFRIGEVPVTMRPSPSGQSMHAGLWRPLYYVAKMSLSMLHIATRGDLPAKRKEAALAA